MKLWHHNAGLKNEIKIRRAGLKMTHDELEKAYIQSLYGSSSPTLAVWNCPFCKKSHIITSDYNNLCKQAYFYIMVGPLSKVQTEDIE